MEIYQKLKDSMYKMVKLFLILQLMLVVNLITQSLKTHVIAKSNILMKQILSSLKEV